MTLIHYATKQDPDFVTQRRRSIRRVAATLALACVWGCRRANHEDAPPPARNTDPLPSVASSKPDVAARAYEFCDILHRQPELRKAACCGKPPERPLVDECTRALVVPLQAGTLEIDMQRLAACRDAEARTLAGCNWVTPGHPTRSDECDGVLKGLLDGGATCHSSLECRSPLHCERSSAVGVGTCKPPLELGAVCGVSVDPLASLTLERNLDRDHAPCRDFCSRVNHRCEKVPAVGSECLASVNCAAEQRCVNGRCSAERVRGSGEDCSNAPCEKGLRCLAGQCQKLARTGEPCHSDFDCAEGGCVRTPNGTACGMKCAASFDELSATKAPSLRLPSRPRAETSDQR